MTKDRSHSIARVEKHKAFGQRAGKKKKFNRYPPSAFTSKRRGGVKVNGVPCMHFLSWQR